MTFTTGTRRLLYDLQTTEYDDVVLAGVYRAARYKILVGLISHVLRTNSFTTKGHHVNRIAGNFMIPRLVSCDTAVK